MPNVLLVNPRNRFTSFKKFENLGLGYLNSYLAQRHYSVQVYDCNFSDPRPEALADYCKSVDPVICGFTTMVGGVQNALALAKEIRSCHPLTPIVFGGYSATFEYVSILNECSAVDFIIRGEGEISLHELVVQLGLGSEEFTRISGLVYRDVKKDPVSVHGISQVQDLDALPFPRRSDHLEEIGLASILSSRGCQAACAFCSIHEFTKLGTVRGIRCRTPSSVVDEIEGIHRETGITHFLFIDDNFFGSERSVPGRLKTIADEILRRDLPQIHFEVSSRATDLRLVELDALAEAGLTRVYLGLESGSDTQLRRYRKGSTVQRNTAAIQALRDRNVGIDFGYIPFDPYLQPQELLDSMQFLLDHDLVFPWTLNTITVTTNLFPGTHLHDIAKADGLLRITEDLNYWFEFKNQEHAPKFERIIRYFKTKYVITVVDRYSNGVSQQGFTGPGLAELQPVLRKLFAIWIEWVRAVLAGCDHIPLESETERFESMLANILSAQLIRSEHLLRNANSRLSQEIGVLAETLAARLPTLLDDGGFGAEERWIRPFATERECCRIRDAIAGASSRQVFALQLTAQGGEIVWDIDEQWREGEVLIDVFVPPGIDNPPLGSIAALPATLYLGSVTGMAPIELTAQNSAGAVFKRATLHKGWSEIRVSLPFETQLLHIKLECPIPLWQPIELHIGACRSQVAVTCQSKAPKAPSLGGPEVVQGRI